MENCSYLKKVPNPKDGRSQNIMLTERGKAALYEHHLLHESFVLSLKKELGPESYAVFQSGIKKLIEFLQE